MDWRWFLIGGGLVVFAVVVALTGAEKAAKDPLMWLSGGLLIVGSVATVGPEPLNSWASIFGLALAVFTIYMLFRDRRERRVRRD